MAMLEQTKNAVQAMIEAGFNRKDFTVRVERITRVIDGKRYTEYGNSVIRLQFGKGKLTVERLQDIAESIEGHQHLHMTLSVIEENGVSKVMWYSTRMRYIYNHGGKTVLRFADNGYQTETVYHDGKTTTFYRQQ